jgi:hypothetical protein
MLSLADRLTNLKTHGLIAGWEAPHPNHGIARGMHPYVIMPRIPGPAKLVPPERVADYVTFLETDLPPARSRGVSE